MKILIVAATEMELQGLRSFNPGTEASMAPNSPAEYPGSIEFLVTGVGMVRTAYRLGERFSGIKPDICVNIGIAGSFDQKYNLGEVVEVSSDCLSELGAEDSKGNLLSLEQMGLQEDINQWHALINPDAGQHTGLRNVRGITVNSVHGSEAGIKQVRGRFNPDIETMESGAVFYSCLLAKVPFVCLRAISNMVEPRDRSRWQIEKALSNLEREAVSLLNRLTDQF